MVEIMHVVDRHPVVAGEEAERAVLEDRRGRLDIVVRRCGQPKLVPVQTHRVAARHVRHLGPSVRRRVGCEDLAKARVQARVVGRKLVPGKARRSDDVVDVSAEKVRHDADPGGIKFVAVGEVRPLAEIRDRRAEIDAVVLAVPVLAIEAAQLDLKVVGRLRVDRQAAGDGAFLAERAAIGRRDVLSVGSKGADVGAIGDPIAKQRTLVGEGDVIGSVFRKGGRNAALRFEAGRLHDVVDRAAERRTAEGRRLRALDDFDPLQIGQVHALHAGRDIDAVEKDRADLLRGNRLVGVHAAEADRGVDAAGDQGGLFGELNAGRARRDVLERAHVEPVDGRRVDDAEGDRRIDQRLLALAGRHHHLSKRHGLVVRSRRSCLRLRAD